ncbi:MAG: hypothetical protein ABSF50_14255 [Burkholderiaceae bacterium]|jgi:hypothetical protein
MGFETTFETTADYLKIAVTGDQTVEAVFELLSTLREQALRAQRHLLLVDYRGVRIGELSTRERVSIGMSMAATLGKDLRVAIIYTAPRVNRFTEVTATIEGASVRTVSSEEEGIAWLRGGRTAPSL